MIPLKRSIRVNGVLYDTEIVHYPVYKDYEIGLNIDELCKDGKQDYCIEVEMDDD
jgi:hypothetical protein